MNELLEKLNNMLDPPLQVLVSVDEVIQMVEDAIASEKHSKMKENADALRNSLGDDWAEAVIGYTERQLADLEEEFSANAWNGEKYQYDIENHFSYTWNLPRNVWEDKYAQTGEYVGYIINGGDLALDTEDLVEMLVDRHWWTEYADGRIVEGINTVSFDTMNPPIRAIETTDGTPPYLTVFVEGKSNRGRNS